MPKTLRQLKSFIVGFPAFLASKYLRLVGRFAPGVALDLFDLIRREIESKTVIVNHKSGNGEMLSLRLGTPNRICLWRAQTFSEKEPETLAWIDKYGGEGAFFDVGANIGLYSLYYAQKHEGFVYAFEPSVKNLAELAENIFRNRLTERITLFPLALSDSKGHSTFSLSSLDIGGALSSFGGHSARSALPETKLAYRLPGLSLDHAMSLGFVTEPPVILKIDVDGIENLILRGAKETLKLSSLRSVLVEVDESDTEATDDIYRQMEGAGFALESREHSQMFEEGAYSMNFNLIWVRSVE